MKILFASSEVAPFSRTGDLADVCGALPVALKDLGQDVAVVSPAYRRVFKTGAAAQPTSVVFEIPIGSKVVTGRLLESRLPGSSVPLYLIDQPGYYDRQELYREGGEDYRDNCERFIFFSRAAVELVRHMGWQVDVLHCHDWQTGLIPAYLRILYGGSPGYEQIVSLLTIHNMADQGQFWHWDMLLTGLDWKYFNWRQMEFWGKLNLLKTGLVFADAITTVSEQYSREIQEEPVGCGLAGVLQQRRQALQGIVNGIDSTSWNPAGDRHLERTFDVRSWRDGKAACKLALQSELGLPASRSTPVIGFVGRLVDQKGWDLLAELLPRWAEQVDVQWAVLGSGEPKYHALLRKLSQTHASRVAVRLEFSEPLAHRIVAGTDMFVVPSRYEPCGSFQLVSLKYGSLPIVRATGGLADTVRDASHENLGHGTANGFTFADYGATALEEALRRATALFLQQPEVWGRLVQTGMQQDWSWSQTARRYVDFYARMMAERRLRSPVSPPN